MAAVAVSLGDNRDISVTRWRGAPPRINSMKILAVTAIGLSLLGPAVAIGVAGKIPLSEQGCGSGGGNQTCSPTASRYPLTPLMAEYIQQGSVRESSVKRTLQQAAEEEHPLDRALALSQARANLQKVATHADRVRLAGLLQEEVQALQEAAEIAPTPKDKVAIIHRGLKQLQLFIPMQALRLECSSPLDQATCLASASLWKQASELFFEYPELSAEDCRDLMPGSVSPFFPNSFYLSSLCLRFAANSLVGTEHPDIRQERQAYLERAIDYLKATDVHLESSFNRALLYEQIGDTYATLWKMHERNPREAAPYADGVVNATVKAHDYFLKGFAEDGDPKVQDLVKGAQQLMLASNFIPSLNVKLLFLREAEKTVLMARGLCGRDFPGFFLDNSNINFAEVLQNRIQQVLAQQKREQQNTLISSFWSTLNWFRT